MFWIRILVVLVLAAIYAPTLAAMVQVWRVDQYAGHGMFVPAFSVLLLWLDRGRLRGATGPGHPAGALVILLGLGVLALGRTTGSLLVEGWSIGVAVAGVVLWLFGPRLLRAAAFPVGFLLLMVPLPRPVVEAVTLDLQLFAARTAGMALGLFDIPFYLSGVTIELPGTAIEVAEICNGLRFLMALLVLTIAFAHVSQRSLPRKAVLVASAIPIAILANATRVAVVAIGAYAIGPQVASGIIHHSIGKGVWGLTLIPLIGLGLLLRRAGSTRDGRSVRQEARAPHEA